MFSGAAKTQGLLGEQVGKGRKLSPHVIGDGRVDALGGAAVVVGSGRNGRFEPFADRRNPAKNVPDGSDESAQLNAKVEGSEGESKEGNDAENETRDCEDLVQVAFFPSGQGRVRESPVELGLVHEVLMELV